MRLASPPREGSSFVPGSTHVPVSLHDRDTRGGMVDIPGEVFEQQQPLHPQPSDHQHVRGVTCSICTTTNHKWSRHNSSRRSRSSRVSRVHMRQRKRLDSIIEKNRSGPLLVGVVIAVILIMMTGMGLLACSTVPTIGFDTVCWTTQVLYQIVGGGLIVLGCLLTVFLHLLFKHPGKKSRAYDPVSRRANV